MRDGVKNVVADILWDEVQHALPRTAEACHCDQCTVDVYTLALNKLPPQYVSGTRGFDEYRKAAHARYGGLISSAVKLSIERVMARPRPGCTRRYGFYASNQASPDVAVFDGDQTYSVGRGPATYSQIKPTGRRIY
jgi:hypothetical protein